MLVRRFSEWLQQPKISWLTDLVLVLAVQVLILQSLGMLTNLTPLGDDALVHVQKISDLARNFPIFLWDPRQFNGYDPSIGFAWASYSPSAFFVYLGGDPIAVFHWTFVAYFLAFGPSVYYFAREVGAQRIVAVTVPILGLSTSGYWGYVGGGAYSRVFTLPLMFLALALTFRFVTQQNAGIVRAKTYWLALAAWVATSLGDVYIGVVPVVVGLVFVLLSAGFKRVRQGSLRVAAVFVPALALTCWFWIPLAVHLLHSGSPSSDLTVNTFSQIFWLSPVLTAIIVIVRRQFSAEPLSREHLGFLFALNLVCVYFLIMGAVTPLWTYIPRFWSTYDSFNILSFLFPLAIACIFALLKPLRRVALTRYLALVLVVLVVANAVLTIQVSIPPNRTLVNNAFAQAFNGNLDVSSNYRVSLQGRTIARWFPHYNPDALQTGGRVLGLDLNPYYQSWYETESYFKDDLPTVSNVYIEDQPNINVQRLVGTPQNFASTTFWLDWYGVGTLVLDPGFYPVQNTAGNFSERGALFSTKTIPTDYGSVVFVEPTEPGPIMVATNAPVLGYYSQQPDSIAEYNEILALLSYLGLDSQYIVPVYLSSLDNIRAGEFSAILTDENTYNQVQSRFASLAVQGNRIIVVSTTFLTQSQTEGPKGTEGLIKLISPLVSTQTTNFTIVSSSPLQTHLISPQNWSQGSSQNAQGSIQAYQNNLTISLTVPDPTRQAQIDIGASLANSATLWDQLGTNIEIQSNVPSNATVLFTSANFTDNYLASSEALGQNQLTSLQIPFRNFTAWKNSIDKFAFATGLNITLTIPPGHPSATIVLSRVSLMEPPETIYRSAGAVPVASNGFIDQPSVSGMVLTDGSGRLVGQYEPLIGTPTSTTVPLASFATGGNNTFDRVVIAAANAQETSLTVFEHMDSALLANTWTTNEALYTQPLAGSFHGLVWKETFNSNWSVSANESTALSNSAMTNISLQYFLAGPGLVYLPLDGVGAVSISFNYQDTIVGLVLPGISLLSLIIIIIFRRRFYSFGIIKQSQGSS